MKSTQDEKQYYSRYIKVPDLLKLQECKSDSTEKTTINEEHLFIVVHQVCELWFLQIIKELELLIDLFKPNKEQIEDAKRLHHLLRIEELFTALSTTFDVLDTLNTKDFLAFRDVLSPASGAQSLQFRKIQFLMGKIFAFSDSKFPYNYPILKENYHNELKINNTTELELSLLELEYYRHIILPDDKQEPQKNVRMILTTKTELDKTVDKETQDINETGLGLSMTDNRDLKRFIIQRFKQHIDYPTLVHAVFAWLLRVIEIKSTQKDKFEVFNNTLNAISDEYKKEKYKKEEHKELLDYYSKIFGKEGEAVLKIDDSPSFHIPLGKAIANAIVIKDLHYDAFFHLPAQVLDSIIRIKDAYNSFMTKHYLIVARKIGKQTGTGGTRVGDASRGINAKHEPFSEFDYLNTFLMPSSFEDKKD